MERILGEAELEKIRIYRKASVELTKYNWVHFKNNLEIRDTYFSNVRGQD